MRLSCPQHRLSPLCQDVHSNRHWSSLHSSWPSPRQETLAGNCSCCHGATVSPNRNLVDASHHKYLTGISSPRQYLHRRGRDQFLPRLSVGETLSMLRFPNLRCPSAILPSRVLKSFSYRSFTALLSSLPIFLAIAL